MKGWFGFGLYNECRPHDAILSLPKLESMYSARGCLALGLKYPDVDSILRTGMNKVLSNVFPCIQLSEKV